MCLKPFFKATSCFIFDKYEDKEEEFIRRFRHRGTYHATVCAIILTGIFILLTFSWYFFNEAPSITARDLQTIKIDLEQAKAKAHIAISEAAIAETFDAKILPALNKEGLTNQDRCFRLNKISHVDFIDVFLQNGLAKKHNIYKQVWGDPGDNLKRISDKTGTFEVTTGYSHSKGSNIVRICIYDEQTKRKFLDIMNQWVVQTKIDVRKWADSILVSNQPEPKIEEKTPNEIGINKNNNSIFFQTNVNRFIPQIFILIAISLLIPIYRYNLLLRDFYHAQADAILFAKVKYKDFNFKELKTVSEIFTPRHDFGKNGGTPMQQIIDLTKPNK